MGKHSIRGVLSGCELNVLGKPSKHEGRHRISGGEYTTVQEPIVHSFVGDGQSGTGVLALRFVRVTYSIAPQGPGMPDCKDKAHQANHPLVWRRPSPKRSEMPPGWVPLRNAENVVPLEQFNPLATLEDRL